MPVRSATFALLLMACAPACAPAPPKPPAARAERVVSLLPSFTEMVVELGAADRLVGCTSYCRPDREVERVGWEGVSAAEAILRLEPDLVLRQSPREGEDPLRRILVDAGVRVLSLPSETIADVRVAILRVGDALGLAREAGAFVERFDAALLRAQRGAVGKERPGVLFVCQREAGRIANIMAAGPGSFLDELIRHAGGLNVLGDVDAPYPSVRLETVVRRRPQVIIDNLPAEEDPLAAWRAFAPDLPAVRDGRVYAVRDNTLLIPGPRLPEAVARLVEMIHGQP